MIGTDINELHVVELMPPGESAQGGGGERRYICSRQDTEMWH